MEKSSNQQPPTVHELCDQLIGLLGQLARLDEEKREGLAQYLSHALFDPAHSTTRPLKVNPSVRSARQPLPDPRLVRQVIKERALRAEYISAELFHDPAWNMLLDLTAAKAEYRRVSVTSLCIASLVPPTTALRWIGILVDEGLCVREGDLTDKRRAFITLSDHGIDIMSRYFARVDSGRFGAFL